MLLDYCWDPHSSPFCGFIVQGESTGIVSPLQFIHGPLADSIVMRQPFSGNTFEIRYVKDRLVNHNGHGQGQTKGRVTVAGNEP